MQKPKPKILVVDDESQNLKVVVSHFKGHPFEIVHAPNGKVALRIASLEMPNLILMDWSMPVMDGIESIKLLKRSEETRDIPIVMTTGVMTSVENLKEALDAGAVDYIRKPFDPVELTARVQSMLRLGRSFEEIKEKTARINELLENERKLLQEQLEQKERELTTQAIYVTEKDNFLQQLYKDMKSVREEVENHLDFVPTALDRYTKDLRRQIEMGKGWDNFMLHFEQVHPEFFRNLQAKYPDLTKNDLKLLAYLKMGMDNKEIAQLTGVEPGTVKTSIHRLKPKMRLKQEDRVRVFVQSL